MVDMMTLIYFVVENLKCYILRPDPIFVFNGILSRI